MVALYTALPPLAGTGRFQVTHVIEKYGENIYPGDKFIMNCPYTAGGTHLPDWTFIKPIFYKDELLFFAFSKAHQMDTSGAYPGGYFANAYDIHAEGLAIPPTKIYERGKLDKDLYDLILNNVRYREAVALDHQALFASLDVADEKCVKLLEKYGRETVLGCVDKMIETMEEVTRREIGKLPDGTYYGESASDDDGTTYGVPVWVRCNVTIAGDRITVDYTPSDKQVKFINSPWALTVSHAITAIFSMLTPPELAPYLNEGSFEPMTIIAPAGSVVRPNYPGTVGACPVTMGTQLIESIFMALSQAEHTKARAGWAKPLGFDDFGSDRRGKGYYTAQFADGGSGAVWGYDGWPAIGRLAALGALRKGNIEITETRYYWFVRSYELTTDSAGAGKWRGGAGLHIEYQSQGSLEHGIMNGNSDGDVICTAACLGGQVPSLNEQTLTRAKTGKTEKVYSKRGPWFLEDGDIFMQRSSGGAGVGNPAEREPELVKMNVQNEFVSLDQAKEVYKVVLDPETLAIDYEATQKLRASAE
jgi:N-methylhydantoinase B